MIRIGKTWFRPIFMAGVKSRWTIAGDFDLEVRYRLERWPAENALRVGLCAALPGGGRPHESGGCVERVGSVERSGGGPSVHLFHVRKDKQGRLPADRPEGRLRLAREGDRIRGWAYTDSGWTLLGEGPTEIGPFEIALGVWGHGGSPEAVVEFRDLIVNRGQVVGPDG